MGVASVIVLGGKTIDRARLAELCERFAVTELAVFGSVARGDAAADSDVDLLYELAPGAHLGFSINTLADEVTAQAITLYAA